MDQSSSTSNNETDNQPRIPSIMDREFYTDMEIVLEEDYMRSVAKKKQKITEKIDKAKANLSSLKRRTDAVYRKELKKLELIQNEKLRLLNLSRLDELAKIKRESSEDKRKMKTMCDEEWNKYMSEEHENQRKVEEEYYYFE